MNNPIPLQIIRTVTHAVSEILPHLSVIAREALKAADLAAINASYHDAITEAIVTYFEGGSVVTSRNDFKQACIQAFSDAFDAGWLDGGGELPIDDAAIDWLQDRINQEFGFIEALFEEAKELRKDKDFDYFSWATARADGYTRTLTELHNEAQVRVRDNVMVTFDGDDGKESCRDCKKLKGQRHKLSWFVSRGYVPPHGDGLECAPGGHCEHYLITDKGEIITA